MSAEVPPFKTAQQLLEESKPLAAGPALAMAPEQAPLAVRVSGMAPEMVEVLKATVCSKFTDRQFLLYVAVCRRKGVDPFTEAYGFPNEEGGLAFGLRIDGMRALAMRTGEYVSRSVETLLVPDGECKGELLGARATIQRKGMGSPVVEEAYMAEYAKKNRGWAQYPETMVRKVAESKALRAAFPDALSGVYEPAELQE